MAEIDDRLEQLQARLDNLVKYQEYFHREISQLTVEIKTLNEWREKAKEAKEPLSQPEQRAEEKPPVRESIPQTEISRQAPPQIKTGGADKAQAKPAASAPTVNPTAVLSQEKSDFEKFIGENLISKIGIVVLVIGVAIGGKYAIDNNLISPAMRIVLGYLFGGGLLGFAIRLKPKYHSFSAVLLSGSMAIMYFITFFAFAIYDLIPQTVAFIIMLGVTVFTVVSAIRYDRQIIAHLGLVGAYLIPFLVGGRSANYTLLFSYIALINAGILAVSVKRYWKLIFYTSFIFTWLIFVSWLATTYRSGNYFETAFIFLTVFFLIFYFTFIIHKLLYGERLSFNNVGLILANSAVFFGLGYGLLYDADHKNYLGLFTIANAGIHFIFAVVISRIGGVSKDLIYLLAILVLTFVTIAVPVQFNGNWVTLIWTVEAVALFGIGRRKEIPVFEYYSYPVMVCAVLALMTDLARISEQRNIYDLSGSPYPLLNANFVTSIVFAIAFGIIYYINENEDRKAAVSEDIRKAVGYASGAICLLVFYNAFRVEIGNYFDYNLAKTAIREADPAGLQPTLRIDDNLQAMNFLWQINYTMLFLALLSFLNIKVLKNSVLAVVNILLNGLVLLVFISAGLAILSALRESYLLQTDAEYFTRGIFNIQIRYISYLFVAGVLFASYSYVKNKILRVFDELDNYPAIYEISVHFILLVIFSTELITWTQILGYDNGYKLGLSILWGIYALCLIVLGIFSSKKHLRYFAISLFTLTLIKLFFYDTAELDTISKTIVFVALGILLLIVSFLYNKYKSFIFPEEENPEEEKTDEPIAP